MIGISIFLAFLLGFFIAGSSNQSKATTSKDYAKDTWSKANHS